MELHFNSKWKKGDTNEYRFVKRKIKIEKENEASRQEATKIVEIKVLESNPESNLIRWTEYEDSNRFFSRMFRKIFKERLEETFTISYTTTKSGIINELIDRKDLDFEIELLKKQLAVIGDSKQKDELIDDVINEELISFRILKSLNIFNFPYGENFSDSGEIEYVHTSNVFLKQRKITAQVICSILYLDQKSRIGEIQIEKKYDQNELNKILKSTVAEIGIRLEKNRKKVEKMPLLVVTKIYKGHLY